MPVGSPPCTMKSGMMRWNYCRKMIHQISMRSSEISNNNAFPPHRWSNWCDILTRLDIPQRRCNSPFSPVALTKDRMLVIINSKRNARCLSLSFTACEQLLCKFNILTGLPAHKSSCRFLVRARCKARWWSHPKRCCKSQHSMFNVLNPGMPLLVEQVSIV